MPQEHRWDESSHRDGVFDEVDRSLLALLQESGRMTLAELGRRVGLSSPSVSDRLRRLEEGGAILGYSAVVNPAALGHRLNAFVRLAPAVRTADRTPMKRILDRPEVLEAHHVVGDDCWIFKVVVRDTVHLERLLAEFAEVGSTTTSIVLSSPVRHRSVLPYEPGPALPED
jgi:Lrp/AsnC family leucine-responsive transcriptional regulator